MSSALPSSGYCVPNPSLGLLIPALVSPGITPPTAEASPSSVLSVLHIPACLLLPALSSSQFVFRSCAVQRGSSGSTADNVQVLKLNEKEDDIIGRGCPSPLLPPPKFAAVPLPRSLSLPAHGDDDDENDVGRCNRFPRFAPSPDPCR
jgi:hypothetical protein